MFVKVLNGQAVKFPYLLGDFQQENPNVSVPSDFYKADLTSYKLYPVTETEPPQIDATKEYLKQSAQRLDGKWVVTWEVVPLLNQELSFSIREKRNILLKESDWTQLPDSPLDPTQKASWTSYREALRDIPEQAGFPQTVVWPTKP